MAITFKKVMNIGFELVLSPADIKELVDQLSSEERLGLFANYCEGCGIPFDEAHPRCYCLNDE
jgi:hypothetical protein